MMLELFLTSQKSAVRSYLEGKIFSNRFLCMETLLDRMAVVKHISFGEFPAGHSLQK